MAIQKANELAIQISGLISGMIEWDGYVTDSTHVTVADLIRADRKAVIEEAKAYFTANLKIFHLFIDFLLQLSENDIYYY